MSNSAIEQLEINNELSQEIETLFNDFQYTNGDKKKMLVLGYLRIAISHFRAINLLTEKDLLSSSFAMIRLLFENVARAHYVWYCADDKKLEKLHSNDFKSEKEIFGDANTMVRDLDAKINIDYFKVAKNEAWGDMCDFAHSGTNALAHCFNGDTEEIGANFSETEIKSMLQINEELARFSYCLFCIVFAIEDSKIKVPECRQMLGLQT